MSMLDFFTTAPKIANDVFDKDNGHLAKLGGWIGSQRFTEQEKAEMHAAVTKGIQEYSIATLAENTERSTTRRVIAVNWFKMQTQLIMLTVLAIFIDHLAIELTDQTKYMLAGKLSEVTFSPMLWGVTSGIGVFFWGSHALRSSKWAKSKV